MQQEAAGQAHSDASGSAAVFNVKTGQGELLNPGQIAMLEGKSGIRFGPVDPPGPPAKPVKPKRLKPMLPTRSDKDRAGLHGTVIGEGSDGRLAVPAIARRRRPSICIGHLISQYTSPARTTWPPVPPAFSAWGA